MTVQTSDFLFVEDQPCRIAAAAPMPFAPIEHGLRFGGMLATNCYRGFQVAYEIVNGQFLIRELRLAVHDADLASLAAGQLFGRVPDEAVGSAFIYRNVPLSYDGKLLLNLHTKPSVLDKAAKPTHEEVRFRAGRLTQRRELHLEELPEEYTPSSIWLDYGVMLWLFPEGFSEADSGIQSSRNPATD